MCLTLPARVLEVSAGRARVLFGGKEMSVMIAVTDLINVGDYVLTTGDYLIKKIDSTEAQEITDLLKSYPLANRDDLTVDLRTVLDRATGDNLDVHDLELLLRLENATDLQALYSEANITRKAHIKDHICVHGIIEFSNYCKNNCLYCGLRASNPHKKNYRLSSEEIIKTAIEAVNDRGYKILVLQSGDDDFFTQAELVDIISKIKATAKCFIYLSVGDRAPGDYRAFKTAGANGALYRFETSNERIYGEMHPGKKLVDRLNNLREMKQLGYVISTGMLVGLPGQTMTDLANDILLMKELGTFMPSIGPLIATKNTPLADTASIPFELMLKVIAATRLHLKSSRLPVTTAMETIGGGEAARQQCFMAGANSIMFNLTPATYRENYRIYDNKFYDAEKRYEKWALFKGELSYEMLENELGFSI